MVPKTLLVEITPLDFSVAFAHTISTLLLVFFLLLLLFFFLWDWGFNSGLHTCKAGAVPLEPHLQPILI
jgi:hypothetical protein